MSGAVLASDVNVAQNVGFYIIAAMMLFAGFRVVSTKNVVHAALWLVVVLGGVAAQYILAAAEFVGVSQIMVYIGAVMVLFLFGIMLTRARLGDDETVDSERRALPRHRDPEHRLSGPRRDLPRQYLRTDPTNRQVK